MFFFDIFFGLLFILAGYVFIRTPIHKRFESPSWIDPLTGFILTSFVLTYFYTFHLAPRFIPDSATSPCGKLSKQIECYNVSTETCMVVWSSSRGGCDEKMAEIQKNRPAALLGAALELCISRNFDKAMKFNRKNENSTACRAYFSKIESR
jgi:hypothetical protein